MKISGDAVVGLRYSILDEEGRLVDETPADKPWFYLHGAKECPSGLEAALVDHSVGDRVEVQLPPEQTYGVRNEDAVLELDRRNLPGGDEPKVGMILSIMSPKGETELRVVGVSETRITVDANHPLAGQTLTFEVEVVEVRRATAAEILEGGAKQTASVEAAQGL